MQVILFVITFFMSKINTQTSSCITKLRCIGGDVNENSTDFDDQYTINYNEKAKKKEECLDETNSYIDLETPDDFDFDKEIAKIYATEKNKNKRVMMINFLRDLQIKNNEQLQNEINNEKGKQESNLVDADTATQPKIKHVEDKDIPNNITESFVEMKDDDGLDPEAIVNQTASVFNKPNDQDYKQSYFFVKKNKIEQMKQIIKTVYNHYKHLLNDNATFYAVTKNKIIYYDTKTRNMNVVEYNEATKKNGKCVIIKHELVHENVVKSHTKQDTINNNVVCNAEQSKHIKDKTSKEHVNDKQNKIGKDLNNNIFIVHCAKNIEYDNQTGPVSTLHIHACNLGLDQVFEIQRKKGIRTTRTITYKSKQLQFRFCNKQTKNRKSYYKAINKTHKTNNHYNFKYFKSLQQVDAKRNVKIMHKYLNVAPLLLWVFRGNCNFIKKHSYEEKRLKKTIYRLCRINLNANKAISERPSMIIRCKGAITAFESVMNEIETEITKYKISKCNEIIIKRIIKKFKKTTKNQDWLNDTETMRKYIKQYRIIREIIDTKQKNMKLLKSAFVNRIINKYKSNINEMDLDCITHKKCNNEQDYVKHDENTYNTFINQRSIVIPLELTILAIKCKEHIQIHETKEKKEFIQLLKIIVRTFTNIVNDQKRNNIKNVSFKNDATTFYYKIAILLSRLHNFNICKTYELTDKTIKKLNNLRYNIDENCKSLLHAMNNKIGKDLFYNKITKDLNTFLVKNYGESYGNALYNFYETKGRWNEEIY